METDHPPIQKFAIGGVPIYGDLILAPMAGYSDKPYRLLCREYGSAMSYTEFVSIHGVLNGNARTRQILEFDASERPVVFQIFGSDEDKIEQAARKLEQLGPDIIDVNMGCSAPKVYSRGAGAALLCDPAKIGRIINRLARALRVPVTAKIRLGWDEQSLNYVQVARIVQDNGAAAIAVHGRAQSQSYGDRANWDAIAEVKQAVAIPVIGNGDVRCAADIERMKQHTGCDGVMIGRAAMGNPWIFQRRDIQQVAPAERLQMIYRHLDAMVDFYGQERGLLNFRKHVVRYLRGLDNTAQLKMRLLACARRQEFMALLQAYEAEMEKDTDQHG